MRGGGGLKPSSPVVAPVLLTFHLLQSSNQQKDKIIGNKNSTINNYVDTRLLLSCKKAIENINTFQKIGTSRDRKEGTFIYIVSEGAD